MVAKSLEVTTLRQDVDEEFKALREEFAPTTEDGKAVVSQNLIASVPD